MVRARPGWTATTDVLVDSGATVNHQAPTLVLDNGFTVADGGELHVSND